MNKHLLLLQYLLILYLLQLILILHQSGFQISGQNKCSQILLQLLLNNPGLLLRPRESALQFHLNLPLHLMNSLLMIQMNPLNLMYHHYYSLMNHHIQLSLLLPLLRKVTYLRVFFSFLYFLLKINFNNHHSWLFCTICSYIYCLCCAYYTIIHLIAVCISNHILCIYAHIIRFFARIIVSARQSATIK